MKTATISTNQAQWLLNKHPGIIWSSRSVNSPAIERLFLQSARFEAIYDLSQILGIDRLRQTWSSYRHQADIPENFKSYVDLILEGIVNGTAQAAQRS